MLAAAALVGAAAAPAHADGHGDKGEASAAVLRTQLDVGLLHKTVDVPLSATLNTVRAEDAGDTADRAALTARLDGVENGDPVQVLRADVARARAGKEKGKSWARVELVRAKVHVPGLPLLSVIEAGKVTARAECAAGERPVAEAKVPGTVRVLGKKVTLTAGGPTVVRVPGAGEVRLELSATDTTSDTAAATALRLDVAVDPLDLGVAEVAGTVTLAEARCRTPRGETGTQTVPGEKEQVAVDGGPGEADDGAGGDAADTGSAEAGAAEAGLAATGGSSATPYLAGGAAVLLAAGGLLVALRRRGRDGGAGSPDEG
ncbi:LPXTG cell wall anchor domain-containing protein [Streptomyces sp. JJ36]|nr:LPXTG cell wall anchor domain-containing protein [Streptomyces sp. JJ36]